MRILATFTFSFSAAVFGAIYLPLDELRLPLAAGLALLAALAALALGRKRRLRRRLLLILLGLALGLSWTAAYTRLFFQPALELDGQTVRLDAVVTDFPQASAYGGYTVPVKVSFGPVAAVSAVLYGDDQYQELRPGDQLTTVAHCVVGSRTFAGEEITYYTAKGIFLRAQTYGRLEVQRPERIPLAYWPALAANGLKAGIDRAFPQDAAGVIRAIVTGNRDNLTDEFTSSLQRTGLSHTVAVSGMHLAFLANLLSYVLGKGRKLTAWLTVGWAVLFCGVAGSTPSVIRAAVMIVLLQLAPLLERQRDGATSLGFALMLLLFCNPFAAAHVGLQLSFAAVAGILLVSDRIQRWLVERLHLEGKRPSQLGRQLRKIPYFIVSTLSATLGATVLTTPLVAVYFGTFSLIAPISNILTLWAVAGLFIGGLSVGALALVCLPLASVLAIPFTLLAQYVVWVVGLLSRPAWASLPLTSPYYLAWVAYVYLLLLALTLAKAWRRPLMPICAGVCALLLAMRLHTWALYRWDMSVSVLDVGQGQSVLLRQRDFLTLVDCGGDSSQNPGDIAANAVQSLGRSTLDLLVLSHYHTDHANGVPQLLSRLQVSTIALPDVEEGDPLREEILSLAQEKGIQVWFIREDTRLDWPDGRSLTVYAPVQESGDTNELGLTVLAATGEFDALITGDMDGAAEERLLKLVDLPDIEVLVAGHHGSASSTTQALLDAVWPETAVVSVGEGNLYGHPAPETLERLAAMDIKIYRTDLDGTVRVDYPGPA